MGRTVAVPNPCARPQQGILGARAVFLPLDLMMPVMNGRELLTVLQEDDRLESLAGLVLLQPAETPWRLKRVRSVDLRGRSPS